MKLNLKSALKIALIALVAALAVGAGIWISGNGAAIEAVQRFGYFGVAAIAFISGFNVIVPIPAAVFLPVFLGGGLELPQTVIAMSIGMTMADTLAFLLGYHGRTAIENTKVKRMCRKLDALREKWSYAPVIAMFFYAMLVPFPNEVMALPLGLMGYKLRTVIIPLFLGNIVFNFILTRGVLTALETFI